MVSILAFTGMLVLTGTPATQVASGAVDRQFATGAAPSSASKPNLTVGSCPGARADSLEWAKATGGLLALGYRVLVSSTSLRGVRGGSKELAACLQD
ncbi:hypothetical protein [Streptomyces sp. NPDC058394]|uniref:hypothetical protein n=1 Tax=Streptomyces sp. NPDC058394 TaxID=3346477 RepID=UPI0036693DE1